MTAPAGGTAQRSPITEAFSITHSQICNGTDSFEDILDENDDAVLWDMFGVNEASVDPDMDDYDNEGDDQVLSTWSWLNYVDIEVQAGYISFPMLGTMTGETLQSTGSGLGIRYRMDIWTERMFAVPPRPMITVMPGRDERGNPCRFAMGFYKVQFKPIGFDGPEYKEGLKVNYTGRALMTKYDEKGQRFADGVGRTAALLAIL